MSDGISMRDLPELMRSKPGLMLPARLCALMPPNSGWRCLPGIQNLGSRLSNLSGSGLRRCTTANGGRMARKGRLDRKVSVGRAARLDRRAPLVSLARSDRAGSPARLDRRVHKGSVVMSDNKARRATLALPANGASRDLQGLLENAEMRVRSALLVPLAYLGSGEKLGQPAHQEHAENLGRLAIAENLGQ